MEQKLQGLDEGLMCEKLTMTICSIKSLVRLNRVTGKASI